MRDNWLSNRIFTSYDDIVDHCCFAWNKLVDQPWRIMSIGLRQWAHGFKSMRLGISRLLRTARPSGQPAEIVELGAPQSVEHFGKQAGGTRPDGMARADLLGRRRGLGERCL